MAGQALKKLFNVVLVFSIGAYRTLGTQFLGGACRFEPSCSSYAAIASHRFPPHIAFMLIVRRLLKCRPWGPRGYDPVPLVVERKH